MTSLGSFNRPELPVHWKWPQQATAPRTGGGSESALADGIRCVIVADDDRDTRRLLSVAIQSTGLEVIEACDGRELLGHFSALGGVRALRLIVSDIQMPNLTGLTALEAIRRVSPTLPVILITAFGDEDTHAQAQRLGAAAVFDKPFDLRKLMELVLALAKIG